MKNLNRNSWSFKLGIFLALVHFALAVSAAVISITDKSPTGGPNVWLVFVFIDFPLSLVFYHFSGLLYGSLSFLGLFGLNSSAWIGLLGNTIIPVLFFGLAGSYWYFYLPTWIAGAFKKNK